MTSSLDYICENEPLGEPLPKGKYFLVDISEAVEEYMRVPKEIRMVGIMGGSEYSETDMLDIELSAIVPCLDGNDHSLSSLMDHIQNLLDDYADVERHNLEKIGVHTDNREIPNTPQQLQHAEVVHELGASIYNAFIQSGVYEANGLLPGEHCSILHGNVLVLRSNDSPTLR